MSRTFLKLLKFMGLAIATISLAPSALSSEKVVDSTILLGMSAPLTGPTGVYGRQMREGFEAHLQRVNADGGIHGRRIRLIALDDGYEVGPAVRNARQLIEENKVFALVGFYGTSSTAGVLPVVNETGVPLIGTISGAEVLRQPVNPHMFHLRASYNNETAAIVKTLLTIGAKRIAVFHQDDGFGQAGLDGVIEAMAANKLAPVAVASVPRNSVEVSAAVDTIIKTAPQAVVMVTLYRPSAEFIRQVRRHKANPLFVALSPVGTDQLIAKLGADEARGIQVSQVIPYPWGDRIEIVREYKSAISAYSLNASLSYYSLEGYINAKLVTSALERVGPNPSRRALIAALRSGPFDLGGYWVQFSANSNSGSSYVEISIIGPNGRILN